MPFMPIFTVLTFVMFIFIVPVVSDVLSPPRGYFRRHCLRPLDYLVKLSAIQPYTPALGTIINLDSLPFGHRQINTTYRTFHMKTSLYRFL